MVIAELGRMPLFEGLDAAALAEISRQMQPRRFKARSFICRQGEPGNSLLVIQRGLAEVFVDRLEGADSVPRLRQGDVIGEISLLTGEPRSAHVRASVTTEVLELSQEAFAALVARHPAILVNLSRILSRRLARPNLQPSQRRPRGEAVALVIGPRAAPLAAAAIEAARLTSPGSVAALDLTASLPTQTIPLEEPTVEGILGVLDNLLAAHARVIAVVGTGQERLGLLLEHVDRIVILGSEAEAGRPAEIVGPTNRSATVVLLAENPRHAPRGVGGLPVIRAIDPDRPGVRGGGDIGWLGRHLSRTKLGLALGAGGAKGYAHVGALHALQEAGYTVDYVAGSSMGALVGAWLALGRDAAEIEATMRRTFTTENVDVMFRTTSGVSAGWEVMARLWRETTSNRSFSDLSLPLVVMSVDLAAGLPVAITEGPLWEALLAATAIPGLFPPYERGEQRLVDGVALVPVPTGAVIEAGADVTLSVNLMNREKLTAWPGGRPPQAPPPPGLRTLDALLDVLELTWRDSSVRHAALADVVITPRFGPASWRSFELADQFVAAGREAAEEQLEALGTLARPQPSGGYDSGALGSSRITLLNSGKETEGSAKKFTLEDVRGILIDLIGLPAHKVPDDLNASFEDLGLDSIAFLEVQIEMEQRYGLRIFDEEARQIRTVGDAIEYVNRRLDDSG